MINNIKVDIEELTNIKRIIEMKRDNLVSILNDIIKETSKTKEYYDSLTANDFRKYLIDYLNNTIEYINKNYLSFADKIDKAQNTYCNYINNVSQMVGDIK